MRRFCFKLEDPLVELELPFGSIRGQFSNTMTLLETLDDEGYVAKPEVSISSWEDMLISLGTATNDCQIDPNVITKQHARMETPEASFRLLLLLLLFCRRGLCTSSILNGE